VAGGIPIIKALREGLGANRIKWLGGIINGTGNFILTHMRDEGRSFDDVLAEAQALGYAEADPTFDVEGIDAAHKLTLLASVAFGIPLQFKRVYTEGISRLTQEDITQAGRMGYVIKHLGIARQTDKGIELRVHPTLVPASQLLASVSGALNAVEVMLNGNNEVIARAEPFMGFQRSTHDVGAGTRWAVTIFQTVQTAIHGNVTERNEILEGILSEGFIATGLLDGIQFIVVLANNRTKSPVARCP